MDCHDLFLGEMASVWPIDHLVTCVTKVFRPKLVSLAGGADLGEVFLLENNGGQHVHVHVQFSKNVLFFFVAWDVFSLFYF